MTDWDVFYPLVLVEAPGCPEPSATIYLRMAARDFCKRSAAWRESLAPITTDGVTSLFTLALDPTWQAQVVRITWATLNGRPLEVKSRAVLNRRYGWSDGDCCWADDCCGALIDQGDGTFKLVGQRCAGQTLQIEVALMPVMAASQCGDVLGTDYPQAIADGALGRLLVLANVPFAAPARAVDCRASFEKQLHSAANADFQRAAPEERRVQPSIL